MPLEFRNNAIVLSGETGTKLKSDIIGRYYPFWWGITSGGPSNYFRNPTAIIEMNAATGEVYIKDSDEFILGSAGHAIDLKMSSENTFNLKVICIEEDLECYERLKNIVRTKWPSIQIPEAEGPIEHNNSNVYLINKPLDESLEIIDKIQLGNSLFFFDPLRNYEWNVINKVAKQRISTFHKTGTEFIIFLFTSDWFLGRQGFASLPSSTEEQEWTSGQRETVDNADRLFGNNSWSGKILNELSLQDKMVIMVELYKDALLKWFRYVLPLPFIPKEDQQYHIFMCSNHHLGVRVTRRFYENRTGNPKYSPDNSATYNVFKSQYPGLVEGLKGNRKPLEWKILWKIIRYHEGEISDALCDDFITEGSLSEIQEALIWLQDEGYIHEMKGSDPMWEDNYTRYKLDWGIVSKQFGIDSPTLLVPIET